MSAAELYDAVWKKAASRNTEAVHKGEGKYVPLLKFEESKIKLCQDGLDVLRQVKGAVGVITVAGPSQSGNTTLLDLLQRKSEEIGEDLHDELQGLWIFNQPIHRGEVDVLAVKSQSFGTSEQDKRLMQVLYVLCSVFIFNSQGCIDEDSMKKLGVIKELPELIDLSSKHAKRRLTSVAPRFVWALQDFNLNITDEQGRPISGKDYLENVLETGRVQKEYTEEYQQASSTLIELFQERNCVRFPSQDADQRSGELKKKFKRQLDKLHSIAVAQCPSKKFFGQAANGLLLSGMLEKTVHCLNQPSKLDLEKSWRVVKENEFQKLFDEVKEHYLSSREIDPSEMPFDENELVLRLHQAKEQAILTLRKSFVEDRLLECRLIEDFDSFFETDMKYTLEANLMSSIEFNTTVLDLVFRSIFEKMDSGHYNEHFNEVDGDWGAAAQSYEEQARGPGRFVALSEFGIRFQDERFARFFKDMLRTYEDKLKLLKSDRKTINTRRIAVEEELKDLKLDIKDLKTLMEEIEIKIGAPSETMTMDQRMDRVIEWLKSSDERKVQLEQDLRLAEEAQYKSTLPQQSKKPQQSTRPQPKSKSCCLVM
jgi:hypothetical protein